jgi:hypothetical protein
MKKFNIEEAIAGRQVETTDGKIVKILHHERDNEKFPIIALIENKKVVMYTIEGKFYLDKDSKNDLILK